MNLGKLCNTLTLDSEVDVCEDVPVVVAGIALKNSDIGLGNFKQTKRRAAVRHNRSPTPPTNYTDRSQPSVVVI